MSSTSSQLREIHDKNSQNQQRLLQRLNNREQSHLHSALLVGLLLHLQLDGEDFGLASSLASGPGLCEGCELAALQHKLASRELPQHQPGRGLGLRLLAALGRLHWLDLCELLLARHRLACCRTGLGGLLEDQGDALCFTTLQS